MDRTFVLLFLLALASFSCNPQQKKSATSETTEVKKPTGPNVIFILADDLGYGDLGSYGQKEIKTPHLDRMAAEGMRFTQHYAGSTVCAPSRASLMSGMHTGHTAVRGNKEVQPMGQFPLPAPIVTVAEVFKQAGYTTGLIGKWGLGGPESEGLPNRQGFDYFYGYLGQRHAHNYYPDFLFRNEDRIPLKNEMPQPARPDGAGVASRKVEYSHDLFADEALQYIHRHQDTAFFLYLATTIPHANNEGREEGMEVPDFSQYAGEDWPEAQKRMAAMVSRLDGDVGRILDTLQSLGIANNTLVIFTSDNGPHSEGGNDPAFFDSNGPLRGVKRDLYEGGIRVPMIAWWPGTVAAGSESDHISAFWDFLPTACALTDVEPELTDGISYLPTLLGMEQPKHDFLYWEFHEQGGKQAVRRGEWKAVRQNVLENPESNLELYNLAADIGENNNVAVEHPEVLEEMRKIMQYAHLEDPVWPFIPARPALNPHQNQ